MKKREIIEEEALSLKKGIDLQREIYKKAAYFNQINIMFSSISNILGEIQGKAETKGTCEEELRVVKRAIYWYDSRNVKYKVRTQRGVEIRLPMNFNEVAVRNARKAYENIIRILEKLELI